MKKLLTIVVLAFLVQYAWNDPGLLNRLGSLGVGSDSVIAEAFENRRSDLQIQGEGEVVRVLPDDNSGSRHQRFVLKLKSGQTLLVAHNIDLAPRIPSLRVGDPVKFYGEYEWNSKGGVIHWTHRDPRGAHQPAWLEHDGRKFQ